MDDLELCDCGEPSCCWKSRALKAEATLAQLANTTHPNNLRSLLLTAVRRGEDNIGPDGSGERSPKEIVDELIGIEK